MSDEWDKTTKRKVAFIITLTLFFAALTIFSLATMITNSSTVCGSASALVVLMIAAILLSMLSITTAVRTKGKGLKKRSIVREWRESKDE